MFVSYCASCHGVDGKGDGPAAAALKMPPTDLTLLSKDNAGEFPDTHVLAVLQHGADIPSHGSPEMPVLGPILGKMEKASPQFQQLRMGRVEDERCLRQWIRPFGEGDLLAMMRYAAFLP